MKNIIVYGFESKPAVDTLLRLQQENVIKIVRWYYDEDLADKRLINYSVACKHTSLWRGEWQQVDTFLDEKASRFILSKMDWLMQEYSRDTEFIREYFFEYKNIMWHMVNEFNRVLSSEKIDCVFFSDVPHGNSSATLYVTARALGIETLYVANISTFPERFFYAHTIEDYGTFNECPRCQVKSEYVHVEECFEKDLYYMTDEAISGDNKISWRRNLKRCYSPAIWFNKRKKIVLKSFEKYDSIYDFIEHKSINVITKWLRSRALRRDAKYITMYDVDLKRKYVYFPLHLQPEMTTDTIGDIYRDQLLAIEKLRKFLPDDWYIYVKENPKQTYMCRNKYFFKRMMAIPNVSYVSRTFDTYELMRNAQFVATITGTAGYEAVTGGKSVLVFGRAWYKTLRGVFSYNDGLRLEDILKCNVSHDEVEAGISKLLKKAGKGIWLQYDLEHVPNLDFYKNDIDLYKSFYFLFTKCV